MTDTDAPEWPDPADKAHAVEQAKWLRNQVAEGGLRFEAYLPPSLALWLLDLIEQDTFLDPSEAVFVILGEHKELEPHADLRRELLKRSIEAAADDPRPGISGEEMKAELRDMLKAPLPEPARWEKRFYYTVDADAGEIVVLSIKHPARKREHRDS